MARSYSVKRRNCKMTKKKILYMLCLAILSIGIISYTDLIIRPGYVMKTMVKLPIFLLVPFLFGIIHKEFQPIKLLKPSTKGLKIGFVLGVSIYIIVLGAYLIASKFVDLSPIKTSLEGNLGINKDNFVYIGLYVCIINSFLEEWFFRGFLFLQLKKCSRIFAYTISSAAFAIYHLAIMDGMFHIGLLALVLLGLFVGGCIFNYLNEKNENIYASWFCHSFANFAMNTIGYLIFFG